MGVHCQGGVIGTRSATYYTIKINLLNVSNGYMC